MNSCNFFFYCTAQKMKFSIKDFFNKSFLQIWSHLLKKSLMENFIFLCSVGIVKVIYFSVYSPKQANCFLNSSDIFFSQQIYQIFAFSYDSCSVLKNFIFFFLKLIVFIVHSLKNSQKCFIQSLPLYTSCLFSMLLNKNNADI